MKTTVVNLNESQYEVYAGRGAKGKVPQTPGQYGWLGNPYSKEKFGTECVKMFKDYFYARLGRDRVFLEEVLKCRGKVLGCFCGHEGCHAQVIADFLNRVDEVETELDNSVPNV